MGLIIDQRGLIREYMPNLPACLLYCPPGATFALAVPLRGLGLGIAVWPALMRSAELKPLAELPDGTAGVGALHVKPVFGVPPTRARLAGGA